MDAEEKKSSVRTAEPESDIGQPNLRLHYFPDLPVDDVSGTKRCIPKETAFQRIHFDNGDAVCPDAIDTSDGEELSEQTPEVCIEEIEEAAYRNGFAEGENKGIHIGEKAGFEAAVQQVEPVVKSLQQALQHLNDLRRETHKHVEREVVELALAIAKKIVCHEVQTDRETVLCVAKEALSRVENPAKVKIKLNPSDLQFIEDTRLRLVEWLQNIENVSIEPDETITSGGCLVETNLGDIDARIEKQFQAVEESFKTELQKAVIDE